VLCARGDTAACLLYAEGRAAFQVVIGAWRFSTDTL